MASTSYSYQVTWALAASDGSQLRDGFCWCIVFNSGLIILLVMINQTFVTVNYGLIMIDDGSHVNHISTTVGDN